MVHMSGHLYNRVGRYEDANRVFARAKAMDEDLGKRFGVEPGQAIWQYYHNVSFQTLNILELGRISEAAELSKIARHTQADIAVRTGDWKNAFDPKRTDAQGTALRDAYLARFDLQNNDIAAARAKVDGAKVQIDKPVPTNWGKTGFLLLKVTVLESEGMVLAAEGKVDEAVKVLRESISTFKGIEYEEPVDLIRIPHETLGKILSNAARYDEAIQAFQDGLKERPNSGWLLFGLAKAKEVAGKRKEAEKAYQNFLKAWATADRDRPEIKYAEAFMESVRPKRL